MMRRRRLADRLLEGEESYWHVFFAELGPLKAEGEAKGSAGAEPRDKISELALSTVDLLRFQVELRLFEVNVFFALGP